MSALAAELQVVLPVSFFERDRTVHYNAIAVIDADGKILGVYRKSHIPQFPGYNEKFYFTPGNTGFRVWETKYAKIGVGICWDQWFPEAARAMVLEGAEMLVYPTAIGSEPTYPGFDSSPHWRRVMQGHAAANLVPLVASNRIGTEKGESCEVTFYGSSFIAGPSGEIVAQADRDQEGVLTAAFDLNDVREARTAWGVFRDRRPDLYAVVAKDAASRDPG
jgi:N-carbamoylputrescine amidase